MNHATITKLLSINRQFYQTFATDFDATRQRIQPGVARVLEMIPPTARILDLGCGNGELARELDRRGFAGEYVGVDFSEGLVEAARGKGEGGRRNQEEGSGKKESGMGRFVFRVADLTSPDWEVGPEGAFDVVVAFAVFHHLPGPFHAEILRKVRELLRSPHPSTTAVSFLKPKETASAQDADDSPSPSHLLSSSPLLPPLFLLSNWQFLNSPRWQARIQPWERVGLTAEDVAPNDYLLDWRRGGEGLRYVHHFSEDELTTLAKGAGFKVVETFASDGAEGNLGLYQIWRPK